MKMYKIVGRKGEALHGGSGKWHLPQRGKPGRWMPPVDGKVCACLNGYHLVTAAGILKWLPRNGAALLCEAEGSGNSSKDSTKTAFRRARILKVVGLLNDRSMRLFAADCAEHVLPLFEKERPDDDRPRKAIQAARDFANGKIGAAARAAAWAAAWDAAGAAAWDAARAAARDAAGAAAWDAAGAAAWDAERKWQARRLLKLASQEMKQ